MGNPYIVDCQFNCGQIEAMIIALSPLAYPEGLPEYVMLPPVRPAQHDGNLKDAFNGLLHFLQQSEGRAG